MNNYLGNLFIRLSYVFTILTLTYFSIGCGSSISPFNENKINQNYNSLDGNPPSTSFSITIQKGTASGPCGFNQELITYSNSICFEIIFERGPSNFNSAMLQVIQPGTNALISSVTNPNTLNYAVNVSGFLKDGSEDGIYNLNIPSGTFSDQYGNSNLDSVNANGQVELSQFVRQTSTLPLFTDGVIVADSCQGLELQTWTQPGIASLNTFFGGSPGVPPASPVEDILVGNLLDSDHLTFRPATTQYIMRWSGKIKISTAGNYRFKTVSDDGSRVYINGVRRVNNDGVHTLKTITSGNVNLASGYHDIEVQFFYQTGAAGIFNFTYMGADTSNLYVSPASEIFRPTNCPKPVADANLFNTYWSGTAPYSNDLIGVVRDDSTQKHIKVSLDKSELIRIAKSQFVDGSGFLTSDNTHVIMAHNNGSLALGNIVGLTNLAGPAWSTTPRIWRMQCTGTSDVFNIKIDGSQIDSEIDSIIFSTNETFTTNIKAIELNNLEPDKAIAFQCTEFNSSIVYFTFGKYNL